MSICWDAIGAIGQWAGAIATSTAVIITIYQTRQKIKITSHLDGLCRVDPVNNIEEHIGDVVFTIFNKGPLPVSVTFFGFRMPKSHKANIGLHESMKKLPQLISPGESIMIEVHSSNFINSPIKNYDLAYVQDSLGRTYYHKASFLRKFTRQIWWKFAK